jgi:hypothetical protein
MNNGRGASGARASYIAMPTNATDRLSISHPIGRATLGIVPPPKNAPPLLNASAYATYSPDLLMMASIDGQVILCDRRVNSTGGGGVGRLEMNEKTPPWCLSVSDNAYTSANPANDFPGMLVCRRLPGLRRSKKQDSGRLGCSPIRSIRPSEHSQVG